MLLMTLDEGILKDAQGVRERLLELQHQTEVTRVDFHHLIRRLHAAGGSLREIAESLGLSHQRVHQIIELATGDPGEPQAVGRMRRRMRGLVPFERFSADARDRVAASIDEATALGHRRVGTEHLLISLTGDPEGPAGRVLRGHGVTKERVVAAVIDRLGTGAIGAPGRRPFTPAARRVLGRALHEARHRNDSEISGVHILLGLVDDGGDASAILRDLGAAPGDVRALIDGETPHAPEIGVD